MLRRNTFLVLIFLILASACVRPASTLEPVTAAARPCAATDLQTSSSSNGTAGSVVLGVTLINQSGASCALGGQPHITLSDHPNTPGAGGQPLDVRIEAAPGVPPASLSIAPGESVIAILTWSNYCGAALKDGPTIHLALQAGESLDIPTAAEAVPRCTAQNEPSTLTVNPYSYPP
jgi:Protein of unknown function (DUF4232)